jgi:hypothetical protein
VKTRILLLAAILSPILTLHAIVDTNENGLSDLWEKQHNDDELFSETFDLEADPDADGWTNAQEAAAGTDPFSTAHPDGHLQPETTHIPATWGDIDNDNIPDLLTPEVIQVSWPTIPGKQYTLYASADLMEESWFIVGEAFKGTGTEVSYNFVTSLSLKAFWRVAIDDIDTDDDGLFDAEENQLGSSSYLADSDSDGIDDFEAVARGLNPLGDGGDLDQDGVPDNEFYSVVFEVLQESQSLPILGFEGMFGPEENRRFLTSTFTEEYSLIGSFTCPDIANGIHRFTQTYLDQGAIAPDGDPISSVEGI